ncbi:MAG TPA: DUF2917 domain-containing protein [Nitrosospira sp.]|nr:DUF2917 domain-containing protein [Nitrosospira sp.]
MNNIIPICRIINWREQTIIRFMEAESSGASFLQRQAKETTMNATLHQSAMTADAKQTVLEGVVHLEPNGSPMRLREGHYVRMQGAVGWTVRTLSGTLWITQDWDSRDIVLNPGEAFVLDRKRAALLWPLCDAEICIGRAPIPCVARPHPQDVIPATSALPA